MINQPQLIDILGDAFDERQAMALAHAMSNAVEQGNEEMASLKDLELIYTKNELSVAREFRKFTIWNAGLIITCTGIVIGALKFL